MQTIDARINLVLKRIAKDLRLNNDTQQEILEEIRYHLEDAVEDAEARGLSPEKGLEEAVKRFGLADVGPALQKVHVSLESIDALLICFVPVAAALVLRWLIFLPAGTTTNWGFFLRRPAFWIVAVVALLIPLLQFKERSYVLITWGIFWSLTLVFATLPTAFSW